MRHKLLRRPTPTTLIACLALFFAIGGGSYALGAATRSTTIRACASKKTGELFIKSKCSKTQRSVTWSQQGPAGPAGATGPACAGIYGEVNSGSEVAGSTNGMTITPGQTAGQYTVTFPACNNGQGGAVLTATPIDNQISEPAGPYEIDVAPDGYAVTVAAGTVQNGTFNLNGGVDFYLTAVCES